MSQVTNYHTFSDKSVQIQHNRSIKTPHYFWKLVTCICCCLQPTASASVQGTQLAEDESSQALVVRAVALVNTRLSQKEVKLVKPLNERDFLLEVITPNSSEMISIISPKDEKDYFKDFSVLANEIHTKVEEHFAFKQKAHESPERYFINKNGCKIDLGGLFSIVREKEKTYLKFGAGINFPTWIVKLNGENFDIERFNSYTVMKTVTTKGRIRLFDDYDDIRVDGKTGFYININSDLPNYMNMVRN